MQRKCDLDIDDVGNNDDDKGNYGDVDFCSLLCFQIASLTWNNTSRWH